jgi:predicted O-methyltransferase YrrM
MLPHQVPGLITREEGTWLARHAAEGMALEIGAFRGRSTCYLAGAATRVITCEPFCGQPQSRPDRPQLDFGEVRRAWHRHVEAAGAADRVRLVESRSNEAYGALLREFASALDLVFVDGSHYAPDLRVDICYANLLRVGGIIAFHDYTRREYPEVARTVDQWSAYSGAAFATVDAPGSLRAFRKVSECIIPLDWYAREPWRRDT